LHYRKPAAGFQKSRPSFLVTRRRPNNALG
jgi:hypothetical protein